MVESRIRRISPGLFWFEKGFKIAQFGAARRISPPWYGFQANLAIAANCALRHRRCGGLAGAMTTGNPTLNLQAS
jgi:hypothetical protein